VAIMLETPAECNLRRNFLISAGMMEGLNRLNLAGAERAEQALAGFLGHEESIGIESIAILPLTMLAQRLRNAGQEMLGCHVRIFGELQAELYCYLPADQARRLVGAVLRHYRLNPWLARSLEHSALSELTNVLASAYWQTLHGHLPLNWRTTVPALVSRIDRAFTLASRIGHYDSLVFHTDLSLVSLDAHLYFCLIPGVDCLNRFLLSLDCPPQQFGQMLS
jgi:chemotaxis protein CheY-P-specific phosphatase CheC